MPLTPYAKIIADSITRDDHRLITMEVRFHRFVLAEFNTHRVFSRNSASSRAIPFGRQVQRVVDDPAVPLVFPAEQKGMQGGDALDDDVTLQATDAWLSARGAAVEHARTLSDLGVHKSVVNRLMEPFMWHTVVVTATSWDNFFEQRVSPLAQPEIHEAARLMLQAQEQSTPTPLDAGQWHLPYVEDEDWESAADMLDVEPGNQSIERLLTKVSAARCARVSYLTQDGQRSLAEDLRLYERLVSARPWHGSPLEHVATPWPDNSRYVALPYTDVDGIEKVARRRIPLFGNLLGWRQLRLEIEVIEGYTPTN